jgi:hypothetical protein
MVPVLVLTLLLRGGLIGTIESADHKPIPSALVIAAQSGRTTTATAAADGTFSLPDVTLPVTIEVKADGFTTVRRVVDASPITITLAPSGIHESIVVTGAAKDDEWRRPRTGTTVLSADTLANQPAVTTDEALRVIGGFSLFRALRHRDPRIRRRMGSPCAVSPRQARAAVGAVRRRPAQRRIRRWVTWTRIPDLATSSIAIDRGAQGSTFGSDALGGVLDISTRTGDRNSVQVAATGGSLGVGAIDGSAGGRSGHAAWFGAASWFRTDGVIPVAPESRGPVDVPADAEWWNAFFKTSIGDVRHRLTFSALAGSDDRGNGTPLQRNRMEGGTAQVSYDGLHRAATLAARCLSVPTPFDSRSRPSAPVARLKS